MMQGTSFDRLLTDSLERLESEQLRRSLQLPQPDLINFASNDYLGLTRDPRLIAASQEATGRYGSGCGASRLVTGQTALAEELEQALAEWKGVSAALTFSSGYAAALGTLPALVGKGDTVILDKRAHACLIDAARLSGATVRIFPHNHLEALERLLLKTSGKRLIVTESVFSMDGDLAPLREIVELKDRYGAWLLVDEAHAVGLYGKGHSGRVEAEGLAAQVEVQMGTLSKALGGSGGYIAGSRTLIDWLINRARSFIYSTAPAPGSLGSALRAIQLIQSSEGETRVAELWKRVRQFEVGSHLPGKSPIFPVIYGTSSPALEAAATLKRKGFWAPAIRYPTVPRAQARLRVTLNAGHTTEQIGGLLAALPRPYQEAKLKETA